MKFFYVWALMRASFVLIVILIYARKALFRKRQKCAKWHQRFLCMYAILAAGASQGAFVDFSETSLSDISCITKKKNGCNINTLHPLDMVAGTGLEPATSGL